MGLLDIDLSFSELHNTDAAMDENMSLGINFLPSKISAIKDISK